MGIIIFLLPYNIHSWIDSTRDDHESIQSTITTALFGNV